MRACENCGQQNDATADFCANPECRTFLGWSTVTTMPPPPGPPPPVPEPVAAPAQPVEEEPRPPVDQRVGFRVRLDPPEVAVEPGGTATARLLAENTGTRVEQLGVTLHGPAAAFTQVAPPALAVYPGTTETAEVTFRPARGPQHPAGPAALRVEVRSTVHPDLAAVANGVATVAPFVDVAAELQPEATTGRRPGRHTVVVENRGNTPVTVGVEFDDRQHVVGASPAQGGATIAPGARAAVSTWIRGPRKAFGTRSYPFVAVVTHAGGVPITLEGVRHQRPGFRWWLWLLLLFLLWVLVGIAGEVVATSSSVDGAGRPFVSGSSYAGV